LSSLGEISFNALFLKYLKLLLTVRYFESSSAVA